MKDNVELYHVLSSNQKVESVIQGLSLSLKSSGFSSTKKLLEDVKTAIYRMQSVYSSLRSTTEMKEFRSAFKRHRREVSSIISRIMEISKTQGFSNPVVDIMRSRIKLWDGFEIEECNISPRSFWKLYSIIGYTRDCKDSNQLIAVLRVVSTLFTLVKDFRLSGPEQDSDVLLQLDEIINGVGVKSSCDYTEEINRTLDLISIGLENPSSVRNYPQIQQFAASLKLAVNEFRTSGFTLKPENLKLSNASTGTALREFGTIPGHIASMFEGEVDKGFDYSEFDKLVGYIPTKPKKDQISNNIYSVRNKSVSIEQLKDSMRLIHILSGNYQDRLTFTEHLRKRLFRSLQADCTFNQPKGKNQILKWMGDKGIRAIYSLDLHACSNTLSLKWQEEVTKRLYTWFGFSPEDSIILLDVWHRIMNFDSNIVLPYSRKKVRYKFRSGQPMGFSDSFYSFAMLHHIIVLTAIRLSDLKCVGYCITGDDSVIAFYEDKGMSYVSLYKDLMAFVDTECQIDKGYIYNADVPGYELRIAEFCKFLICEGQDITPIPFNILCKTDSFAGKLLLLGWIQTHTVGGNLTPELLARVIDDRVETNLSLSLLSRMPLSNIINSKRGPFALKMIMEIKDAPILLAASLAYLKQVITLDLLIEVNRDPEYVPQYSDIKSFLDRKLRNAVRKRLDNPSDGLLQNKFVRWFKDLELKAIAQGMGISSMLNGILPDVDILEIIPVLKEWRSDDLETIIKFSNFWDELQKESVTGDLNVSPEVMYQHLALLERLSYNDLDSQNHRFGSKPEKIFSGFDDIKFLEETLENSRKLGIPSEDFESFLEENNELWSEHFSNQFSLLWSTTVINVDGLVDKDSEYDPWNAIYQL